MRQLYWFGTALVVILGLGISVYFGIRGDLTVKVPLSQFSSPEVLGEAAVKSLLTEMQSNPIAVFGLDAKNESHWQVLEGFLLAASNAGVGYEVVVVDQSLGAKDRWPGAKRLDTRTQLATVGEILANGQTRQLVLMPQAYSSQKVKDSPAQLMRKAMIPMLSFSAFAFPTSAEAEKSFQPACVVAQQNVTMDLGHLGCLIISRARLTYRGVKQDNHWSGMVDQASDQDYLILLQKN